MAKMGRPRLEETANRKVSIRFTESEFAQLEAYAKAHGLNKAQAVKECFMERLKQEKAADR
ncbi:MAG: DUF6290 family protein [Clostridiales bacterium]|nr:DUF6290 family protein [Clostridiales bacterium]